MIALWTLKERCWVVMVRSEYFPEVKRLVSPLVRLLLGVKDMLGCDVCG